MCRPGYYESAGEFTTSVRCIRRRPFESSINAHLFTYSMQPTMLNPGNNNGSSTSLTSIRIEHGSIVSNVDPGSVSEPAKCHLTTITVIYRETHPLREEASGCWEYVFDNPYAHVQSMKGEVCT